MHDHVLVLPPAPNKVHIPMDMSKGVLSADVTARGFYRKRVIVLV
jgi:hypothetical protein